MTQWARVPQPRDQMVLFSDKLDDVIPPDHVVRLLDEILERIDWTAWEAGYFVNRGQPAIHPRVLAGIYLYGILTRIRTTRALEEALQVRLDFRWLAHGRSIDHTTLSEFRRKHKTPLKTLFVQIGVMAHEMGWLALQTLAYDGTRLRANNRRGNSKTREELKKLKAELAEKFQKEEALALAEDARDAEILGEGTSRRLPADLAKIEQRRQQVELALAQYDRLEAEQATLPKRLPLTDPQSRIMPNKEGGHAPNFTPTATVDVASGLVVDCNVLDEINEDRHLAETILQVQTEFGLESPPPEMLADGLMASGENMQQLADLGVDFYTPGSKELPPNPAIREDLTQPVPEELWPRLPVKKVKQHGQQVPILAKEAFVFDEEQRHYRCPNGQVLKFERVVNEVCSGRRRTRERFAADPKICAACPLRAMCLQGKAKKRQIYRDKHEKIRRAHEERMATPEAKAKYALRNQAAERPFATVKSRFGIRQFLLRGLDRVRLEWQWMMIAVNLDIVMRRLGPRSSRAGPRLGLS